MISGQAEQCCGCTACEKICGHKAISMKENSKGFLEPVIDLDKCVNCGLCHKVCPLYHEVAVSEAGFRQNYYAAKRNDDEQRRQSQSGGAFAALAEEILNRNGSVYGVVLNEKLDAVYDRIVSRKKLKKLKGSKYVQASVGSTYLQAKSDLENGKWVLFSGTPCHIHGLKCFLERQRADTEKLVTVDLICHGVPSPKIYREYKQFFSEMHGKRQVTGFNFRDKRFGWHGHVVTVTVGRKQFVNNDFVRFFYSHFALRDSCYVCHYTSLNRQGDITIGDCWGIEKFASEFDDAKGCSLVLINTSKGQELWNSIGKEFEVIKPEREEILQPNLQHPTEAPEQMGLFWEDYKKFGCEYVLRRYCECDPSQEYEIIEQNQYIRRFIRKAKKVYHRIFVAE